MTVTLGACATGSLIAPVSFHRFLAGHNLKPALVRTASRMIGLGLALLALTIGCALLLLLRTATGSPVVAWAISAAVLGWFATSWLLLPYLLLRRAEHARATR